MLKVAVNTNYTGYTGFIHSTNHPQLTDHLGNVRATNSNKL
ncbi:MAG: hypothetical protein ACT4ON_03660 [Bacteroidota bacterium]